MDQAAEPSAIPPAASPARRRWLPLVWLVLLVQGTLFWEGCDNHGPLLSVGAVGRIMLFSADTPPQLQTESFSLTLLALNVLAVIGAAVLVLRAPPDWARRIDARRITTAVGLATFCSNSVLFFPPLWVYTVGLPISWILSNLFFVDSLNPQWLFSAVSRIYYVLGVGLFWGLMWLMHRGLQRYLFIDNRWQFSLGGALVVMTILGTGLGFVLRWLWS